MVSQISLMTIMPAASKIVLFLMMLIQVCRCESDANLVALSPISKLFSLIQWYISKVYCGRALIWLRVWCLQL